MTEHHLHYTGPRSWGTGGHDHHRRMSVDASGRRVGWWSCDKANGGPCPDEPDRRPPEVVVDERRRTQVREAGRRWRERRHGQIVSR